jgi:hypothetical protein
MHYLDGLRTHFFEAGIRFARMLELPMRKDVLVGVGQLRTRRFALDTGLWTAARACRLPPSFVRVAVRIGYTTRRPAQEVRKMKSNALRTALLVVVAVLLLSILWIWLTLNWTYSEGERAGYVQKLSNKGWLCKTWEGEIAMVTMPGAIPEKFQFTVRDTALANRINELAGRRVVLSYQQHKFIPSSCFGETEYFVTAIREVLDQPLAPSATPQGQLQPPR